MLELKNITLVCVTSVRPERALKALKYSMIGIKFHDVMLLTSCDIKDDVVNIIKIDTLDYIGYSRFVVYDLIDYIDSDYVILIQDDGFIVNPKLWRDEFLNYDYIGAPWPIPNDNTTFRDINGNLSRVGNGGFTLRSKKLLSVPKKLNIEWRSYGGFFNEDGFICASNKHLYEQEGCKIAPIDIAKYFSHESEVEEIKDIIPFGFHGRGRKYDIFSNYILIEGSNISSLCDYSFGDFAGVYCNVYGGFMKLPSLNNKEFTDKINEILKERNYMTLFIDNIRLYNRKIICKGEEDQKNVDLILSQGTLLELCSNFPEMNFIIFCNLEDSPIDSDIENKIPKNVLSIYAANAIYNNDKVKPFPYGIQRKFHLNDFRKEIMSQVIHDNTPAQKLLYINHNENTNPIERKGIKELFVNKNWSTVNEANLDYIQFISMIKYHKFMISPEGNAIDCHRSWEILYLKRVPVMKKHPYFEKLFKGFPVLFVDSYSDITEDFLLKNEHLYKQALNLDIQDLNLNYLFNLAIKKDINNL